MELEISVIVQIGRAAGGSVGDRKGEVVVVVGAPLEGVVGLDNGLTGGVVAGDEGGWLVEVGELAVVFAVGLGGGVGGSGVTHFEEGF